MNLMMIHDGSRQLNHAVLLSEIQVYCEATRVTWINFDPIDAERWGHYAQPDSPLYCSVEVGMTTVTTDNTQMEGHMAPWFEGIYWDDEPGKPLDDL